MSVSHSQASFAEQACDYSAFISYANEDKQRADEVVAYLEARGFKCWIAPRDARPGRRIGREIIRGINQSQCFILVLSSAANISPYVYREVNSAVAKGKPICTMRVENVMPSDDIELFVTGHHWLDAWQGLSFEIYGRGLAGWLFDEGGVAIPDARPSVRPLDEKPVQPNLKKKKKEFAAWNAVKDTTDLAAFRSFLRRYPDGAHAAEARARRDKLSKEQKELSAWGRVKDTTDLAALRSFIRRYPDGAHAAEARARRDKLLKKKTTAEKELAAWNAVKDTTDLAAVRSFIGNFPNGTHAVPARELRDRLLGTEQRTARRQKLRKVWRLAASVLLGFLSVAGILVALQEGNDSVTVPPPQETGGEGTIEKPPSKDTQQVADLREGNNSVTVPQVQGEEEEVAAAQGHEENTTTVPTTTSESAYKPGETIKDCDVCPKMVVVPAQTFRMGSPSDEKDRSDNESPQHEVTFAKPFAIGKYEVTFAEWDACVADGGCSADKSNDVGDDEGWGRGERPVINVSWNDAKAYVAWLSAKTGKDYRLPSEAEWEYAARAGSKGPFWRGDAIAPEQANYTPDQLVPEGENRIETGARYQVVRAANLYAARPGPLGVFKKLVGTIPRGSIVSVTMQPSSRWAEVTYGGRTGWMDAKFLTALPVAEPSQSAGSTFSVDKFDPNPFGLYSVHGNVWEWVADCWHDDYVDAPSDGAAWTSGGDCDSRVLRSGSWNQPSQNLRSAYRDKGSLTSPGNSETGLRVARALP